MDLYNKKFCLLCKMTFTTIDVKIPLEYIRIRILSIHACTKKSFV